VYQGLHHTWNDGMEKDKIKDYLNKYFLKLIDYKDSKDLEKLYFTNKNGKIIGRINETHFIVTAEKK